MLRSFVRGAALPCLCGVVCVVGWGFSELAIACSVLWWLQLGPLRSWPGGVCVSRSIGDVDCGPLITPLPHVKQVRVRRKPLVHSPTGCPWSPSLSICHSLSLFHPLLPLSHSLVPLPLSAPSPSCPPPSRPKCLPLKLAAWHATLPCFRPLPLSLVSPAPRSHRRPGAAS